MSNVDLRACFPPVGNQQGLHSCTALVLSDAIGWELQKHGDVPLALWPSSLFLYYNARMVLGVQQENIPVNPSAAIAAVRKYGICDERLWPYNAALFAKRPPIDCYQAALRFPSIEFQKLAPGEDTLQGCLDQGQPFFFCLRLYDSNHNQFWHGEMGPDGILKMPRQHTFHVHNHAMLAVGYDATRRTWLARNHFGSNWGDRGHIKIPYDYFFSDRLAYGFWRVKAFNSHQTKT